MSKKTFICEYCGLVLNRKDNIKRHILNRHFNPDSRLSRITCPYCSLQFIHFKQLDDHVQDAHNIKIEVKDLLFKDEKEFYKWKEDEEIQTKSEFFVQQNHRNKKGERTIQYHCTRSGTYKPKTNERKRSLRVHGTRKIGAVCLARINAIFTKDGVKVKYFPVHGPHEKQFCHLSLPKSQEKLIASKIENGSNFNDILDEVRNEIMSASDVQKKYFLSKKKLYNIKKKYKITSKHKTNDPELKNMKITSFLDECKKMSHNPFLVNKRPGEKYKSLKTDEIFMVVMTENQLEMLKTLSTNFICIDSMYDGNKCDYHLTIIEVVDEFDEVFPCAYCVSSRVDVVIMSLFFSIIRNRVGEEIQTSTFMSGEDSCFYEAWEKVMNAVQNKILCRWCVDQNISNYLANVTNKNKKYEMMSCAKRLLEEIDENKFTALLEIFLQKLIDNGCHDYHNHFVDKYATNAKNWAACYRNNSFINTSLVLETFHKIVKQIYTKSNKSSLDTFVYNLLKLVRNRILDRMISFEEGHVAHYVSMINKRHKLSSEIKAVQRITNYEWRIQSTKGKVIHNVREKKAWSSCACKMKCSWCNTCVHEFSCTCHDYLISNNLCKHIHAVNISITNNTDEIMVVDETKDTLIDDNFFIENIHVEDFVCEIVDNADPESERNLLNKFEQICDYIKDNGLNSIPEGKRFDILKHTEKILNILRKYENCSADDSDNDPKGEVSCYSDV